jgi:pyrimidine and pyridine-specific 5'-nucleotidase
LPEPFPACLLRSPWLKVAYAFVAAYQTATAQILGGYISDDRDIVFFDIDNCLYSASTQISVAMGKRIHGMIDHFLLLSAMTDKYIDYFVSMGFPEEEATELHHKYYTTYGLALRGLTRHHDVGTCA